MSWDWVELILSFVEVRLSLGWAWLYSNYFFGWLGGWVGGWVAGESGIKANLSLIWSWSWVELSWGWAWQNNGLLYKNNICFEFKLNPSLKILLDAKMLLLLHKHKIYFENLQFIAWGSFPHYIYSKLYQNKLGMSFANLEPPNCINYWNY